MDAQSALTIDGSALMADIAAVAEIGATKTGGVDRVAYSESDTLAREYVEGEMRALGMAVYRDAVGNSVGRLEGSVPGLPAIAVGSHTDSVPDGGHFDGVLGVAAGLAVVRALGRSGAVLRHPLEVINFAAEEGALAGGTFGSRAMAGISVAASLADRSFDGVAVAEHFRRAGYDPDSIPQVARASGELKAFFELHIEQGRELEGAGKPIGVVTAIAGIYRYSIDILGVHAHAGTARMKDRDDALVKAAELVLEIRRLAETLGIQATIGTLRIPDGAPNVVPGRVEMSLEARGQDVRLLEAFEAEVSSWAEERTGVEMTGTGQKAPVPASATLVKGIEAICERRHIPFLRLPSGAGHDAGNMARLCDVAMIFVPSRDGLSHNPKEHTEPQHCLLGAELLLEAVVDCDRGDMDAKRD